MFLYGKELHEDSLQILLVFVPQKREKNQKKNSSVSKRARKHSSVGVIYCKTPWFDAFGLVASFAIVHYGFSFPFIRVIYKMFLWLRFNFPVSGCIAFH